MLMTFRLDFNITSRPASGMSTSRSARSILPILACLTFAAFALGQSVPKGFVIPKSSHSPDHRYGVAVPIFDISQPEIVGGNTVVELKTGRVIADIDAEIGFDRALNFRKTLPARWSRDSSVLVWTVDGKWFPTALVAMKIEEGKVKWQMDVLKTAQKAILARTKKAAAQKYAAAKKQNEGNGSAYPEGFTIEPTIADPIALPLKVHVKLSANPKQIEGDLNLDSHLDAVITPKGKFVVKDFQLGAEEW